MTYVLLAVAVVYCAYQVMRAQRLLNVTIWLALTSALVAIQLYLLGAPEVAVMELSVGAGLVTVLFVYAFSIVGEATVDEITSLPRPLVWIMILGVSFLLGWLVLPLAPASATPAENTFAQVLWRQRGLDVIAQVILIFSGVMGLLGLLSDTRESDKRGWLLDLVGGQRVSAEELAQIQLNREVADGKSAPAQEAVK